MKTSSQKGCAFLFLLIVTLLNSAHAQQTLVAQGSNWKYLDNGTDQGTAWIQAGFDDSSWKTGKAELGYGDNDEATTVGYGSDANNKFITTYFRTSFTVTNPTAFTNYFLRLLRDDGAVIYVNGNEVWRSNMPAGSINFSTLATAGIGGTDETTFVTTTIPPSAFVAGKNVIAVEIHQSAITSTDISFDFELMGSNNATVTRGPYLQSGAPNSLLVRWRTDIPTDSRVRYGATSTDLNLGVVDSASTTEHIVKLTGLTPNTKYFYAVGSTTQNHAGGDESHFFITAPTTAKPTRVWVIGDAGQANDAQKTVRDAYANFAGTRYTDLWLMLGDNAYNNGTDAEYQAAVFNLYPTFLKQSVVWPTIGNHDTAQSPNPAADIPYYQIFSLPQNGEAGGLASGTEDYYSFDYGNIHFVCLDSMTSDRQPGSAMLTWLASDLASQNKLWVIAFWHHPPYSKGSHDSDTDTIMSEMRQNVLPVLDAYNVDLVLSGHSHSYERSFLIDSHYGKSNTFTESLKKSAGGGRVNESGAYTKANRGAHEGTVYAVAGSSSLASGGALNHQAMFVSLNNLGSMVLDVDGNKLEAKFLRETGAVADSFTMLKGATPREAFTVSAANYQRTSLAVEGLISIFGSQLAPSTATASSLPLPINLSQTVVRIKDSAGIERNAPLLYASLTQINCQIPTGTRAGNAVITIVSANGAISIDNAVLSDVAPGIFTVEATGSGLAAANVQRVKNQISSFEPIVRFDNALSNFVAIPIDLSATDEAVYLVIYGTGIRQRSSLNNVKVNIDGIELQPIFVGSQGTFVGLDQINVLLPTILKGRGEVVMSVTVDGKNTNAVKVNLK